MQRRLQRPTRVWLPCRLHQRRQRSAVSQWSLLSRGQPRTSCAMHGARELCCQWADRRAALCVEREHTSRKWGCYALF